MKECHVTTHEPEHLPGSGGRGDARRSHGPAPDRAMDTSRARAADVPRTSNGLRGVPELHGLDDDGREILEYVEGRGVPVDQEIVLDNVLTEAVTWLRDFHDLVEGFRPDGVREWRGGEAELDARPDHLPPRPGRLQLDHPERSLRRDDRLGHGRPGPTDRGPRVPRLDRRPAVPRDRPSRTSPAGSTSLVDAYGEWGPMTVLDAVVERMTTACDRIEAGQERGDQGFVNLGKVGRARSAPASRLDAFVDRLDALKDASERRQAVPSPGPTFAPCLSKRQVQRRDDEQVHQRRGQQPAENDHRHRVLDLVTGDAPGAASGRIARPVASAVIMMGASRSDAPRMMSSGPSGTPSSCSRCWKWVIIKMPLRAAMPNTVKNPINDPSDIKPSLSTTANTPPANDTGSNREAKPASHKLLNAACSSRKITRSAARP